MLEVVNSKWAATEPNELRIRLSGRQEVTPELNSVMPCDININGWTREILPSGCVLYLPLYHTACSIDAGGSFRSLDSYNRLCAVTGAIWHPEDGRYFDGSDDKIVVPDADSLDLTAEFTLETWASITDYSAQREMISKNVGGTGGGMPYEMRINLTGKMFGRIGNGSTDSITGSTTVIANTFNHFVFVLSATQLLLYLNGVSDVTPVTRVITPVVNASNLEIGSWVGAGLMFKGLIGAAYVYNRAFTASEVKRRFLTNRWRYK